MRRHEADFTYGGWGHAESGSWGLADYKRTSFHFAMCKMDWRVKSSLMHYILGVSRTSVQVSWRCKGTDSKWNMTDIGGSGSWETAREETQPQPQLGLQSLFLQRKMWLCGRGWVSGWVGEHLK